jgi:ATP-binding cassette subfamily F protein uup
MRSPMAAPLLHLRDVALTIGATQLLDGAELLVTPRARIGLVGRNGSGKSTLLRIASGEIEPERGERFVDPSAIVRVLDQDPDLSMYPTVLDAALADLGIGSEDRARATLGVLGFTGDELTNRLSGGEARRVAIVRALAADPDVLLLDEPTNHLDLPAIEWLEGELLRSRAALVVISHDRRFLERLTNATIWLERGKTRRIERGFSAFEAWREEVEEEAEKAAHKLDRKIVAEEHWVRYGVTARRKRNVRRMSELQGLRQTRQSMKRGPTGVVLTVSEADSSSTVIVEAEAISKSLGGRIIVKGFSTRILRGDRIGIVGANGAGKTTLLKLLLGDMPPDSGVLKRGPSLDIVTIDQTRSALDANVSVQEILTGGRSDQVMVAGQPRHVVGYLKDFLFEAAQARQPVAALSGGEKARLLLARALCQPSNVIVLDEPTNDLDLDTLDLLQEMLADYPGTVMLVSHDRDFLDRVATSIVMSEGEGRWVEYAGGYSDMLAQRGSGIAARSAQGPDKKRGGGDPRPEKVQGLRLTMSELEKLKVLPKRIETLSTEITRLEQRVAEPDLYTRDKAGFETATRQLAAAQTLKASAEDEWLMLEMKREEVEALK